MESIYVYVYDPKKETLNEKPALAELWSQFMVTALWAGHPAITSLMSVGLEWDVVRGLVDSQHCSTARAK